MAVLMSLADISHLPFLVSGGLISVVISGFVLSLVVLFAVTVATLQVLAEIPFLLRLL